MSLVTYPFKKVSGKMTGVVLAGREASVEVEAIDIQHLKDSSTATVRYFGKERDKKTFSGIVTVPFSLKDEVCSHFFSEPIYRGFFSWLRVVHIDIYRVRISIKDEKPYRISINVEREKLGWFGNVKNNQTITLITGESLRHISTTIT